MTDLENNVAARRAALAEYSVESFGAAPEVLLMALPKEMCEKLETLCYKSVLARTKYGEASAALGKFRKAHPGVVVGNKGKGVRARRLWEADLKAARKMRSSYLNVNVFVEEVRPLFESVVATFASQMDSDIDAFFGRFWESQFKITRARARDLLGVPVSVTVEELLARCITTLVKIHECEKVDDAFIAANGDLADRVELLRQNVVEVAHEMLALLQDVHRAINPITEKDFLGLAALAA